MTGFVARLEDARRVDEKQEYKAQLDELDKQHKFVVLRSLYDSDYEVELHRSLLTEKLYLIYEKLCYETGKTPVKLNHKHKPQNDRFKSCPNCNGRFHLLLDTAELCCTQCGLLEEVHGASFDRQGLYSNYKVKRGPTKRYTFKYRLNKALDECKELAQLSLDHITQAHVAFAFIEEHLPKIISYSFVTFKILDKIVPQGPQRTVVDYLKHKIPKNTRHKHEQTWNHM